MSVENLEKLLIRCISLLEDVKEEFWSKKMKSLIINKRTLERDADEILSWFGGMGSLNDLYICEANGHRIKQSEEDRINLQLRILLEEIYEEAEDILRIK